MRSLIFPLLVVVFVGCDARVEHFPTNDVYALTLATSRGVGTQLAATDTSEVIESLFGTPEEPKWPAEMLDSAAAKSLIGPNVFARAAGPVYSDRDGNNFGLFNKHCVNCHALSGSGTGAASVFQNPYPRDFRAGIFKWKATERNAKPTRDGLASVIHNGVAGTGMPSFALLSESDWTVLTDYAIFLAVRGETERKLMEAAVDDLDYADDLDSSEIAELTKLADSQELIRTTVNDVVESWLTADSHVVAVPKETDNDAESIKRGKDIFHGQIANCVGCHGPGGNGSAVTLDYDDWSKEYSSRIGLTPTDRDAMKPFRKAGAHRPRQIRPRKLDEGVFRGGGDSATLYRRISQGIAGTPMPSVQITAEESPTGLSSDQAWDVVHYLQSLKQTADSE